MFEVELNPNQIDLIGTDQKKGVVVLTLTDHLNWEDEVAHLKQLQEKLNTYIGYVESGDLAADYPESKDLKVHFEVVFKHQPTARAKDFLNKAKDFLKDINIIFNYSSSL
ncbi:MAG: hypothetical protein C0592_11800 [Marinilabiliales bacterium]|nr:MAG: hypothetical protein C0592_11800 [Marinilabiliales bacterium]